MIANHKRVLRLRSSAVIGWQLGRSLEAELAAGALRQALASRCVTAALIHHSDRGVQYASALYTGLLNKHEITTSMSRKGNPYNNAQAESFMKTLKYEEVLVNEYETLGEARRSVGAFLDRIYNEQRLHSALCYIPPAEYESIITQPLTTP